MWRMGFVIIHDKITLHSASRGGQEPSRKHCILFYLFFFTGIKHTISREFSSVTQTLRACLCWKAVQGSQNTQQQVSWYGAVLCHTVLVVWVHSHGFSTELARTSQLPIPVWHHLGWIWEGSSKPEAAVAEQTLPSLSAQASEPLTTFVFMQSEENVHLLCFSWCYSFYCDNIRRSKGNFRFESQRMWFSENERPYSQQVTLTENSGYTSRCDVCGFGIFL